MARSDEDIMCTPPEIRKDAGQIQEKLLPEKLKDYYINAYFRFKDWCKSKSVLKVSENVVFAYFEEQTKSRQASTLWATFSMLKQILKLKENIDISKYKVIAFFKRKNESYVPKKAAVFEQNQITKFITEAPDEYFLSFKVLCFGNILCLT